MVLVERKLSVLPETSWLWLATQFLAHDWFSLSHIFFFFFKILSDFRARFADDRAPDDARFQIFINRAYALQTYCCCNNRNIFQGMIVLFFLFFFIESNARDCHQLSIGSANDDCETRERRKVQKTKDLPGHGIWKVRELKGGVDTCHDRLGSFCKQAKNRQDCSERLEAKK